LVLVVLVVTALEQMAVTQYFYYYLYWWWWWRFKNRKRQCATCYLVQAVAVLERFQHKMEQAGTANQGLLVEMVLANK
jgi:hypothetical protein